ncbi:hypothetical protein Poli38472_009102 [Pythium oligandrum]|uniref:START domain-containing protein n=1 Tax=Pythium oligandrum TaxID=41045 RepID=A0A8K1FIF7_PYTOL|nr:hypothetical protein Poli38472_009102 [Pythium oligandrum]|eukprot:TMW64935.1 hypothetical protein Poli38472_009102 [Pythium oligandrum]
MFGFMTSSYVDAGSAGAAPDSPSRLHTYATVADIDFPAFGAENVQILLQRDSGEDGVTKWDLTSNDEGDQVWRGTVEGSSWSAFRVKKNVYATKGKIEEALLDVNVILKLDEMTESFEILHVADKDGKLSLRHSVSKGVFPVAARDFVVVTKSEELADGRLVVASRSLNLLEVEPIEGIVRGQNIITGYIVVEKQDANGAVYCEVTLIAHADLKGYIPASVVSMLGTSSTAKVLSVLKAHLEK